MIKNKPVDKNEINQLVKQIAKNDTNAFDLLYEKMHKVIFRFLKKYHFDTDIILDAINSTYLKISERAKKKLLYINCFSWILTIAKNELFALLKQRKQEVSYDKMDSFSCENEIHNLEFNDIINRLPDNDRLLIYYIFYRELKYKEITRLLHCSESTIKRRKREILEILKGEFKDG